jgi:hypothetical protein
VRSLLPAALTAVMLAAPALASVESELVKQGVQAYDDLDHPRAVELLERALQETLTREELVVTYRTLAFCHDALGQPDRAQRDFERLLLVDRRFELDRTSSPRVRAVFQKAREAVATGKAAPNLDRAAALPHVQLDVAPRAPYVGEPVTMGAVLPDPANTMHLFYRAHGEPVYLSLASSAGAGRRFESTIPAAAVRAPALEYYAVALDPNGVTVAQSGSLGEPLVLAVAERVTPVYRRAWLWTVISIVAVGAAVAGTLAYVYTTPSTLFVNLH